MVQVAVRGLMIVNEIDKTLLDEIDVSDFKESEAYNIRKNGKSIKRKINDYVDIEPKEDGKGINVYVKENTYFGIVHIPVILTQSGLKDVVYNDFYVGKNANVIILAGCGIHNDEHEDSEHDGIHRFFIEEGAKVKYTEKHYGNGRGTGKRILNPVTEINLKKNASMTMDSVQIKGVSKTKRVTKAKIYEGATLVVKEKILTSDNQVAKTDFVIDLKGDGASCNVTSRSVATENSYQEFKSVVTGKAKSYAHVSCDAIIKDDAKVKAIPEIYAKDADANLVHEAVIGKIAGEQLMKLMSLELKEKEAEDVIIKGFLK